MTPNDVHGLVGAYALDALNDLESRQFENHLSSCETCSQELRGLTETTARLGLAMSQVPSRELRDRVMVEVGRTRQLPPAVRGAGGRHRGPHNRLFMVTTAACLIAAMFLGFFAFRTHQQLDRSEALNRQITAVLAAPDATSRTAQVAKGGSGTVVSSRSTGRAVVIMAGLPELPGDRTYELWLLGPSAPRPTGLLGGSGGPVLIQGLGNATQVGVTVEPAGGSDQPTSNPIFATKIPA